MARILRYSIFLLFSLISFNNSAYFQGDPEALYEKAHEKFQNNQLEEAFELITDYLNKRKNARGFYLKALIQEKSNDFFGALESLTASIQYDVNFREAYFKRGELYLRKNYFQLAIEDFTYLISTEKEGNTNAVFFQLDLSGQEQVKISSLESMKGKIYSLRGQAYSELDEYTQALEDYNRAVQMDSSAEVFVDRAVLLMQLNRNIQANTDLQMALSIDSTFTLAWYNKLLLDPDTRIPDFILKQDEFGPLVGYRAIEAFQEGKMNEAGSLFEKALKANPDDPLILINYGRYLIKENKLSKARNILKKALEVESNRIESLYLIGNAFFKDKKYEEAIAYYENYLSKDAGNANVWYNAAVTYYKLKNNHDSCRCLKNAQQRGGDIDKNSTLWKVCE